jgi:hypothetical protein
MSSKTADLGDIAVNFKSEVPVKVLKQTQEDVIGPEFR